jgi:hypothetical protein
MGGNDWGTGFLKILFVELYIKTVNSKNLVSADATCCTI